MQPTKLLEHESKREKIQRDIEAYLANGGEIYQAAPGEGIGNPLCREYIKQRQKGTEKSIEVRRRNKNSRQSLQQIFPHATHLPV